MKIWQASYHILFQRNHNSLKSYFAFRYLLIAYHSSTPLIILPDCMPKIKIMFSLFNGSAGTRSVTLDKLGPFEIAIAAFEIYHSKLQNIDIHLTGWSNYYKDSHRLFLCKFLRGEYVHIRKCIMSLCSDFDNLYYLCESCDFYLYTLSDRIYRRITYAYCQHSFSS